MVVDADVMLNEANPLLFDITCHAHQVQHQHNSEKSLLCYDYLFCCMLRCVIAGFLTKVFCCHVFLFPFFFCCSLSVLIPVSLVALVTDLLID